MRDRADELVRQALNAAKFDFARPDPRVAWEAFKAFAARDVPEFTTTPLGYSACNASDRDAVLRTRPSARSRGKTLPSSSVSDARPSTPPCTGCSRDIEATYRELQSSGANIVDPLEKKPWSLTQFTVEDLDGNLFYIHHD